jgi:hypothetical protein
MYRKEFKKLLEKLRPVIGEMADAFWLGALLEPERQRDIYAVAQALAAELLDESYTGEHILLEPPPEDKVRGDYPLGSVIYADKPICSLALREEDLQQHVAILGRSGSGKTNLSYILVYRLLEAGKPFTVLDWRATYRHFVHRPEGKNILLLTLGEKESPSFNLLAPPDNLSQNMSEAYLRDMVSIVGKTYLPGHHLLTTKGVEYFFLKALDFYKMFDKPVTFKDIMGYVDRYSADKREGEWKITTLDMLFKLTTGPIGRLMNSESNLNLADIFERPVILELTGLGSETDRSFFTQALFLWLYYHRLAQGRAGGVRHVTIIEEAHNLFLRNSGNEQSIHDFVLRQLRELGESVVLLDQNPSLLSIPVLGNCGTTIALNLKHMSDVEAAGKALTLPHENRYYIGRLPVGSAIVKLADRWQKPFLVRFPRFPVSNSFQPPQAKRRDFRSDSVKWAIDKLHSALNEAISLLPERDRREDEISEIAPMERDLLADIAKHSLAVVTERYARLGWNARTGTGIKQTLLERGLIEQEKVSVPDGSVTLLKVTEKGRELLSSEGIKVKALPKNASMTHEYWKRIVAEDYKKRGYTVEEEVSIGGGKTVDLVASKDGKRIAIEVETGKSDVGGNVRKCREAGFDEVVTIGTCSQILKTISKNETKP